MIRVLGVIETRHNHPGCVAAALEPDNLNLIRTEGLKAGKPRSGTVSTYRRPSAKSRSATPSRPTPRT